MYDINVSGVSDSVARICQVVTARTCRHLDGLNVERAGDHVVVSGRAPTYFWKQVAIEAALDVARVTGNVLLRFDIAVDSSPSNSAYCENI